MKTEKNMLKEVRNAINTIIEKDLKYNEIFYLLENSISSLEYVKSKIIQEKILNKKYE